MSTTPHSPPQTAMFPGDRPAAPETVDVQPLEPVLPTDGDSTNPRHETTAQAGMGEFNSYDGRGMPPLAEHTLTDTHSCARLLSTFADCLVVADTPGAGADPLLYVVDPATGLVSSARSQCRPCQCRSLTIWWSTTAILWKQDSRWKPKPMRWITRQCCHRKQPSSTTPGACARPGRRTGTRRWPGASWSTTCGLEGAWHPG